MKTLEKREKWLLCAYLAGFLILALTLAVFQPLSDPAGLTSPPDESARYAVPLYIYEHGTLPTGLEEELRIPGYGFSYALYNTFPYIVMGGAMRLAGLLTADARVLLICARLVNVLSGLMMAWVVWRLSLLIFRRPAWRRLFCAAVTYQPMNVFVHSYVNTDSFCMLSTAMMVYALVRIYREGAEIRPCLWLAAGVSLCGLSYYSAYGYVLSSVLLFIARFAGKDGYDWREMLRRGLPVAGIVILCIGWWFIRAAIVLDGDFLGLRTREALALQYADPAVSPMNTYQARGISFTGMLSDLHARRFALKIAGTLVAAYGSLTLRGGYGMYALYALIWGGGAIGACAALPRAIRSGRGWKYWFFHGNMLVCAMLPLALLLRYCYTFDYQEQGRYLLPGLVPAMYYVTAGLREISDRLQSRFPRLSAGIAPACGAAILLCAAWQVFAVALPAFPAVR